MEFLDGVAKVFAGKVRPEDGSEIELGVGAFPQHKIAEPLLAAGANQQIDLGNRFALCSGQELFELRLLIFVA